MLYNLQPIRGKGDILYNINWCHIGMAKFPEDSKEFALFFKVFVRLARKLSVENYEGEIFTI
jgi:hypothetical protein